MLGEEEIIRYSRQIVLDEIGFEGQEKLLNATVAIIGLGGLGSPVAMLLASMGVGRLILVDRDVVSKTDLHREPLYREEDVELAKVEAAANRLRELNPRLETILYPEPIYEGNVDEVVEQADVVVDGLDSMPARHIVNRAVVRHRKPYVFAGAVEMYGNITTIIPYETPCLECFYRVYSDEGLPTCATVGVHPSITTLVASLEVVETVSILVGRRPRLFKKLLYIDLRNMEFEKIGIERIETCPVCGDKPSGTPPPVSIPEAELSCARDGSAIYIINRVDRGVELDALADYIVDMGWGIRKRGRHSLSFEIDRDKKAVILSSGVLIGMSRIHRDENLDFFRGLREELVKKAIHTR